MRQCPGCKFPKAEHEIDRARFDFACPRCFKHNFSEFVEPPPLPVLEPVQDYGDWQSCYCYGGTE